MKLKKKQNASNCSVIRITFSGFALPEKQTLQP